MALSFDSLPPPRSPQALLPVTLPLPRWPSLPCRHRGARGRGPAFLQVAPEACARGRCAWMPTVPQASRCPRSRASLAIKDNMNLVGTRTTCASRMLEDYQSVYTATCVQRMLDAGCLPMGKANMDEFCLWQLHPRARRSTAPTTPGYRARAGGSSGGSAAAVAAGEVALAGLGHRRLHPSAGVVVRRGGL